MSRHRNVRTMNYDDDYEGYNDVYGHSLDDDYGVSPSASQYLYDRNSRQTQLSHFVGHENDIVEEPEEHADPLTESVDKRLEKARRRLDSLSIESAVAKLGADEEIRLKHCLETIRDVCGDSVTDNIMKAHIIQANFNSEKALDNILSGVELDPAAVLPEDLWKKHKQDSEPSTKPPIPAATPSVTSNIFTSSKPSTQIQENSSTNKQLHELSKLKLQPKNHGTQGDLNSQNGDVHESSLSSLNHSSGSTVNIKEDVEGSKVVQAMEESKSKMNIKINPLFRTPTSTPTSTSRSDNGLLSNIRLNKNPLFSQANGNVDPTSPTSSTSPKPATNPLFGKSPIFSKSPISSDSYSPAPGNPLFSTSFRPIYPVSNPLFSAQPIIPAKHVNGSPVSAAFVSKPSLHPVTGKKNNGSAINGEWDITNNNISDGIICNKPSLIGSRLAEAAVKKQRKKHGLNEPPCFQTWILLSEKFADRVFKFDTPSPDKLVGIGIGTPLNLVDRAEPATPETTTVDSFVETKQFPKTAPKKSSKRKIPKSK